MAEVKTYGQVIGHVADAQFNQCARRVGRAQSQPGEQLRGRGQGARGGLKGLADSFALCDKAFEALTDANASEMLSGGRGGRGPGPRRCWASSRTATRCTASTPSTSGPRTSCRRPRRAGRGRGGN
jgi:hypothetical protein